MQLLQASQHHHELLAGHGTVGLHVSEVPLHDHDRAHCGGHRRAQQEPKTDPPLGGGGTQSTWARVEDMWYGERLLT